MYGYDDSIYLAASSEDIELYEQLAYVFAGSAQGQISLWFASDERIAQAVITHDYYLAALSSPAALDLLEDTATEYGRRVEVKAQTVVAASPVVIGWRRDIIDEMASEDPRLGWQALFSVVGREDLRWAHVSGATGRGSIVLAVLKEAARRIDRERPEDLVKAIEQKAALYAESEVALIDAVLRSNVHAFVAQEQTALSICRRSGEDYYLSLPSEGTLLVERPLVFATVPDGANQDRLMSDGRAFGALSRFLETEQSREEVAHATGYRSADGVEAPTDTTIYSPPQTATTIPSYWTFPTASRLATDRASWSAYKRPAAVFLVVDTSGSMDSVRKMTAAKEALLRFINTAVSSDDLVGLISFSSDVHVDVPLIELDTGRLALRAAVDSLIPTGSTRLLDAVVLAKEKLEQLAGDRQKGLVLLTDGEENSSTATMEETQAKLQASPSAVLYGIAYTETADRRLLETLAGVTAGEVLDSQTNSVVRIFERMSQRF